MKLSVPGAGVEGSVSSCLREHAELLERSPVEVLDESGVIDLVKANQRTIRLLEGVGSVAAGRLTELGGLSAEDVFSTVGRQSTGEARRVQHRAVLADVLPGLTKGFMAGTIPTANLDTVAATRHRLRHNPAWQEAFDGRDASITRKAARMNPQRFSTWMRDLVDRVSDDGQTEQQSQADKNSFRSWTSTSGRWQARLDLDPITGERVQSAIDTEARSLAKQANDAGEPVHHGEHLNAGAVCSLIDSGNGTKGRPSIHVICDLDTLTGRVWDRTIKHTGAGNTLPLSTLRQFLCDAWITHTVLGPSGKALAVGRSHRTATDTQRTALRVMYPTCALCDVRFDHCEMHHIIEWEHGGATDLANLIPLCTIHHDRVHHGWRIELNQDRLLRVYRPDGQTWRTIPLPSAQPAQARNHTRKRQQHHEHHRHRTRSTTE